MSDELDWTDPSALRARAEDVKRLAISTADPVIKGSLLNLHDALLAAAEIAEHSSRRGKEDA